MTRDELVRMLSERVGEDFAGEMARRVVAADAVATLYAVATDPAAVLPRPLREKVAFRSAYVLERLYFRWPERFMPHAERFCERDFAAASGMSARRCFGKIMADLLRRFRPSDDAAERIAEAAAEWLADLSSPVAVKVRGCLGRRGVERPAGPLCPECDTRNHLPAAAPAGKITVATEC